MKRVVTDLAVLFKDSTNVKNCFNKNFAKMDKNEDNKINKEEFVEKILGDNRYSQALSLRFLDLFVACEFEVEN
jgi:hypothetical protein